jgi:hypothetical protein
MPKGGPQRVTGAGPSPEPSLDSSQMYTLPHPTLCRYLLGGPEPRLLLGHHRSLLQLHTRWTDMPEAHHRLQGTASSPLLTRLALSVLTLPWATPNPVLS